MHAYTATATPRVREDIQAQLSLQDPVELVGTFDRPELTYRVLPRQGLVDQFVEAIGRHRTRQRSSTASLARLPGPTQLAAAVARYRGQGLPRGFARGGADAARRRLPRGAAERRLRDRGLRDGDRPQRRAARGPPRCPRASALPAGPAALDGDGLPSECLCVLGADAAVAHDHERSAKRAATSKRPRHGCSSSTTCSGSLAGRGAVIARSDTRPGIPSRAAAPRRLPQRAGAGAGQPRHRAEDPLGRRADGAAIQASYVIDVLRGSKNEKMRAAARPDPDVRPVEGADRDAIGNYIDQLIDEAALVGPTASVPGARAQRRQRRGVARDRDRAARRRAASTSRLAVAAGLPRPRRAR